MQTRRKPIKTEQGVASILVVLTLMTLLALISIGFSRLMNREVRQSLDRQLSTAAYFAAEAGVNDAQHYLETNNKEIKGCEPPSKDPNFVEDGNLSGDKDATFRYSCLIVNPAPKELQIDIPVGQSKLIKLVSTPKANLGKLSRLYFGWQNTVYQDDQKPQPLGKYSQFPQSSIGINNTGLLRVGIYPTVQQCQDVDQHSNGTANRFTRYSKISDTTNAAFECASRNFFMYPSAATSPSDTPDCSYTNISFSKGCAVYESIDNNAGGDGAIVPGNCKFPAEAPGTTFHNQAHPTYCNTVVANLLPIKNAAKDTAGAYYLRLTAVYKSITVFIQATENDAAHTALKMSDAQAVIDATGNGNDIFRRIQVKAPLQKGIPPVHYGLQSMESVCKLFRVPVPGPGEYGQAKVDAGSFNTDNNCDAPTGSTFIDPGDIPPVTSFPLPKITFTASPDSINKGSSQTIKLSWKSDADNCQDAGGPWNITSPASEGTAISDPIDDATTFTIICAGPGGSTTKNVIVNVILTPSVHVCKEPSYTDICQDINSPGIYVLDYGYQPVGGSTSSISLNGGLAAVTLWDQWDWKGNCVTIYGNIADLGVLYSGSDPADPHFLGGWDNQVRSIKFGTDASCYGGAYYGP